MKAITGLKNGKNAFGDDITIDILKHDSHVFINALKSYLIIFLSMVTSHHAGRKVI